MDRTRSNPPNSDSSDTESEDSSWDDEVATYSPPPLGKTLKSYKTPTSMFKVKTPTSRDMTEKATQMKGGSITLFSSTSSSPSARTFIGTPPTPSPNTSGPSRTSSSRMKAIEDALNSKFVMLDLTPSKPPRKSENTPNVDNEVIVISDEDDPVLTDTDISQLPTRPASLNDISSPTSTNSPVSPDSLFLRSSQLPTRPASLNDIRSPTSANSFVSSDNSLFIVSSSSSSASSVDSFKMDFIDDPAGLSMEQSSSRPGQTAVPYYNHLMKSPLHATSELPVSQDDIFNAQASNITMRKRACLKVIQSPVATQPNSPVSPPGFYDQSLRSLASFSTSAFGTNLEPVIIAHDKETQALLDKHRISWGTQYELARGVSLGIWQWEEVKEKLGDLTGDNAHAAYKVRTVMRGKSVASENPSEFYLWQELDREQAAIEENKSRGLGLMGEWKGVPNWYGGQVQQIMRLVENDSGYRLSLEPMEKRRSHRFARFYGSRRFLRVRISEDLFREKNDEIRAFFVAKFILCGRVFVPFHSKDGGLYMVESTENWERGSQDWCGDQFRQSFWEFINWHNPLGETKNYSQAIGKYSSRFALGLSNSVPAVEFATEDIHFIDDIAASDWPKANGKPPTEKLMTDGCGLINSRALRTIVRLFNYENLPAGIQGRIDGSKGFWILHPTDDSDVPKVWIRDSQNKIKNSGFDRAHRIFDLLSPSRPSPSATLSAQSIVNLDSNGVPASVLIHLMEKGLLDEISPLLEWDKQHAMVFLWDAVNKCGKVSGTRTQRLATALNRVLGLKGRDWGQDEDPEREDSDEDSKADETPFSTFTGRNKYSGAPLALYETTVELIQAGFHPARNQQLFDKLKFIIEQVIKTSLEKYRIPISESLGAYVVPDPLGILKEGEIFYRFSKAQKDPRTEMLFNVLTGDVIVGRYPIRLPSDMQKVKAVDLRELYNWPDVVIISTQGSRSLASILSGGDTDGDELIVIWDPLLVKDFENKPLTECPKNVISDAFLPLSGVENVAQFCSRIHALPTRAAHEAFQEMLMANLAQSNVGIYSTFHDCCVAMHGYEDPKSIRLAYIVATLLDASKTGHRLQPRILEKDRQAYSSWARKTPVPEESPPNILTELKAANKKKGEELLGRHRDAGAELDGFAHPDADLKAPYEVAVAHALEVFDHKKNQDFTDELALIRKHVKAAMNTFKKAISKNEQASPPKSKKSSRIKSDQEDLTLKAAQEYAEPIKNILLTRNVEEVKASYAYRLNIKFAFSVAFNQLCLIKARASPEGIAPCLRIFDEGKSFTLSFLRALPSCENESGFPRSKYY